MVWWKSAPASCRREEKMKDYGGGTVAIRRPGVNMAFFRERPPATGVLPPLGMGRACAHNEGFADVSFPRIPDRIPLSEPRFPASQGTKP